MYIKLLKNIIVVFTGILITITAGTAFAGLSFVTTNTLTLTQPFNGISGLTPKPIGSTLDIGHLDFTGPGSEMVTYTYLGAESVAFVDKFYDNLGGTVLLESDPVGTSVSSLVSTIGPLSFMFEGNTGKFAINGGPWYNGTSIGLIGTDVQIGSAVFQYVIGYNDSASIALYGDWDDFVIGVNAVPVPELEVYAMLLAGLGLLGYVARRREQNLA